MAACPFNLAVAHNQKKMESAFAFGAVTKALAETMEQDTNGKAQHSWSIADLEGAPAHAAAENQGNDNVAPNIAIIRLGGVKSIDHAEYAEPSYQGVKILICQDARMPRYQEAKTPRHQTPKGEAGGEKCPCPQRPNVGRSEAQQSRGRSRKIWRQNRRWTPKRPETATSGGAESTPT